MRSLCWTCWWLCFFGRVIAVAITADTDIEGAAGQVRAVSSDERSQTMDVVPVEGWWFMRLTGLEKDKELILRVPCAGEPDKATPRAAFSTGNGSWKFTAPGHMEKDTMVYHLSPKGVTVMVAKQPPYTLHRAADEVQRQAQRNAWAEELELGEAGNIAPLLRIAEGDRVAARRFGIWIQAQQRPHDMAGSWVCQGVIDWLAGGSSEAQWMRQNAEVHLVPVLNATRQAKKPATVAAAQSFLSDLASDERLDVFIDLQGTAGKTSIKGGKAGLHREFLKRLTQELPNTMATTDRSPVPEPGITADWALAHGNESTVALTLAIPTDGESVSLERYDAVGAALARAVEAYLEVRSQREGR